MKKTLGFIMFAFTITASSQAVGVEKTIFGIQTGPVGIWIHNESKLSKTIVLRSEVGIEHDFFVGEHYSGDQFILQPVITLEPRYYYNILNRNSQGKKTSKNSANYFSLKTSYHPDWFVINLEETITRTADLSIVPTWGIKRQIGNNFTFETAVGLGYRVVFLKPRYFNGRGQNVDDSSLNQNQFTPYFHLRIGYTF